MRNILASCASVAFAASAFAQCGAPKQLWDNGSFELPAIAGNGIGFDTPTGWQWTGAAPGFLFYGSVGPIWPNAHTGRQFIDIGNNPTSSGISRSYTVPIDNANIQLRWRANTAQGAATSPYEVRVYNAGNQLIRSQSFHAATGGVWLESFMFLPSLQGTYRVQFQATGAVGGFDTLIDRWSFVRFTACSL
jgi:hypothetical protein